MDYALFAARHPLPANEGALCLDFNFGMGHMVKSPLWETAMSDPNCRVYVTGLTPALTEFIGEFFRHQIQVITASGMGDYWEPTASLTLLHFDRESGTYWEQKIF
jgi:hypothetical protein